MYCLACGHNRQVRSNSTEAWWLQPSLFKLSPTRDTSSVQHHIELPEWLKDLDKAVRAAWSKRAIHYPTTAVLLLSWEDTDMRFAGKEINRLQSVLQEGYGCEVDQWLIPHRDADLKTLDKIRDFLDRYGGPDNLVVVYYAGHGRPGNSPGSSPVWYARESLEDGEELDTSAIQQLLTRAREDSPDVLLLHDCCHPLSAHPSNHKESRAVVECIFAGGFESRVPISGPDSFTRALTEELSVAESNGETLSVVELHRRLICRLVNWQPRPLFDENDQLRKDKDGKTILTTESRVTPSHLFLSKRDRTIRLVPKSAIKGKRPMVKHDNPDNATGNGLWPKAMLAIRLVDDPSNTTDIKAWLLAAPSDVIDFVGIHPSFSSLLLLAVPIPVWDMLPDSDAVSFIGFKREPIPQTTTISHDAFCENAKSATVHQVYDEKLVHPAGSSFLHLEPEVEDDEKTDQPLKPTNEDQKVVISLLNAIDRLLPLAMKLWKKARENSNATPPEWLFDYMSDTISRQAHLYPGMSSEMMLQHKGLLFRYLDARELLESDNGLFDISGRLKLLMGPVYNWCDFDQHDMDKTSRSSSFNRRGARWSRSSNFSIADTAPSSLGEQINASVPERPSSYQSNLKTQMKAKRHHAPRVIDYDHGHVYSGANDADNEHAEQSGLPPFNYERFDEDPTVSSKGEGEPQTVEKYDEDYLDSTTQHAYPFLYPSYDNITHMPDIIAPSSVPVLPVTYENAVYPTNSPVMPAFNIWEERQSQYKVEHSAKFMPGAVFKLLWSEPQGSSSYPGNSIMEGIEDIKGPGDFNGDFNVGFRKLMIVATDEGHSTCVPILTYGGKGCAKRGVKPAKHGIVYEEGQRPRPVKGEPMLGFDPVRVRIHVRGEHLPKESRINYSKLVTVEHNVKVFFVGNVATSDIALVANAVESCWDSKIHRRRRN